MVCRAVDFRPYKPAYDPQRIIAHALPLTEGHKRNDNLHHVIPHTASAVSAPAQPPTQRPSVPDPNKPPPAPAKKKTKKPPKKKTKPPAQDKNAVAPLVSSLPAVPKSLPHGRRHKFAVQWKHAFAEEKAKLEEHCMFITVPGSSLPKNTVIPRTQIRFVYK